MNNRKNSFPSTQKCVCVPEGTFDKDTCQATCPDKDKPEAIWLCTREPNHPDEHVSCMSLGIHYIATWNNGDTSTVHRPPTSREETLLALPPELAQTFYKLEQLGLGEFLDPSELEDSEP